MRKKTPKTLKVLNYIRDNPTAKATEVAKATGATPNYVYGIIYKAKKNQATQAPISLADVAHKVTQGRGKVDNVNHPPHYKTGGIETIDFIEAKGLNYNLGNVVKYLSRADHKGARLENLEKAEWYLKREIATVRKAK